MFSSTRQTPESVRDYRPIKPDSQVLSKRLAPLMNNLVMPKQIAFIKGRAIHDNFRAVQSTTKLLHVCKLSTILLKVDIAKAFDTVTWTLIDLLCHLGFSRTWINWVSILLSTASTRILLNGQAGRRICHTKGLRKGDPPGAQCPFPARG
jgi:hypothetical protein